MTLLESLAHQKVVVVISLFGQHTSIKGKLLSYEKPWVELEICKIRRLFNENALKEIVPIGETAKLLSHQPHVFLLGEV